MALFLSKKYPPSRVDLFRDVKDGLQGLLGRSSIKFKDVIDLKLCSYGSLKLQQQRTGWEDVSRARYDVSRKVAPRDASKNDGRKRLISPLSRPVEDEMDPFKQCEGRQREANARTGFGQYFVNEIGISRALRIRAYLRVPELIMPQRNWKTQGKD